MTKELTLWQLWRFRPGATVRDAHGSDWVKTPAGQWKNVSTAWWGRRDILGSWKLRRAYGPLRRMY